MPRPRGGRHTLEKSTVLAVRVPNEVAEALLTAAGSEDALPEYLRHVLHAAAFGKLDFALGPVQAAGYNEGKRQGWAHANAVFRKALGAAVAELKG